MSPERGRYTTIHGIDGTGKTETAREVAERLAARGIPTVNYDSYRNSIKNPHTDKKEQIDKTGTLEERLVAYLESTMFHSEQINALVAKGYHVVKSRYLDDVMAHFAHLGVPEERMREIVRRFPIVQPDLKVILTVDEKIRRQRLNERPQPDERDRDEKLPGSRALFFEQYLKDHATEMAANPVLHIDTGVCNTELVAKTIVDHIVNL